jgi:hypothetical protein
MSRPDPHDRTVDALSQLAAQASPPPGSEDEGIYSIEPPPPPPPAPEVDLPNMGPPSSADPISMRVRSRVGDDDDGLRPCLYCGYILDTTSGLRCSECGTLFSESVYERWFGGDEERRFDRVGWLLMAVLFAKLWFGAPGVGWYSSLIVVVAAGYACWLALSGKEETTAGMYAMAGMAVCLLSGCMLLGKPLLQPFLECAIAGLLLAAMVSDPARFEVLASRGYRRIAIALVFVSPFLAAAVLGGQAVALQATSLQSPPGSTAVAVLSIAIPGVLSLGAWGYVWWAVRAVSRTLFLPGKRIAD